jgi:hypothetical protein
MESIGSDADAPPKIHVRWFRVEVQELLSIAPIVLNSMPAWRPLTRDESDACEAAWQALPPSNARSPLPSRASSPQVDGAGATDEEPSALC